jgi:hypothetical protein
MITTEEIAEILKNRKDGISETEITPHGHVEAQLVNRVDTNKSYGLVVHPIKEKLILRVWVSPIARIRRDSNIFRSLTKVNFGLRCGCVGTQDNGSVTFQINHICTEADKEPSPEIIERLLDESIEAVQLIEEVVLYGAMVESGVPRDRADQIVKNLLGNDQKDENTGSEVTL